MKQFSILIFHVASQKPAVFFFTGAYKKFLKNFQGTSRWLLLNYDFFLQVSELNNKLDELSLEGWMTAVDFSIMNIMAIAHNELPVYKCHKATAWCFIMGIVFLKWISCFFKRWWMISINFSKFNTVIQKSSFHYHWKLLEW